MKYELLVKQKILQPKQKKKTNVFREAYGDQNFGLRRNLQINIKNPIFHYQKDFLQLFF